MSRNGSPILEGEALSGPVAMGDGNSLEIHKELHFPHSLGLLYSAVT